MPICYKCGTGFDIVGGRAAECPKCGSQWVSPGGLGTRGPFDRPNWDSGGGPWSFSEFLLLTGMVICICGCIFAILKTLYGLYAAQDVASMITIRFESQMMIRFLVLLDGFVSFCFFGALVVTFSRVRRLR